MRPTACLQLAGPISGVNEPQPPFPLAMSAHVIPALAVIAPENPTDAPAGTVSG